MQITIRDVENRNVVELGLAGKNQTGIYGWVQKELVKWERTGDVPHT